MQFRFFEDVPDISDVIRSLAAASHAYTKFLSANDLGLTDSHQAGIYLSKDCWPMFFSAPGRAQENREVSIPIQWGADARTTSSVKWYGSGSRAEYRLTRTRAFFRGQEREYLGSLFVLARAPSGEYRAWVLVSDDDIEDVLTFLGIAPLETNQLVKFDIEARLAKEIEETLGSDLNEVRAFPDTEKIARWAQLVYSRIYRDAGNPDDTVVNLIRIDYAVFRHIERRLYADLLSQPFPSLEALLSSSLEIHNRRKSRAGLSLEHHLRWIFSRCGLAYTFGGVTEEHKKPDFVFPGIREYRDPLFPVEKLFFLGAKTTCKDRWRQVISEAHRIPVKYLFTLQQGITSSQLSEMASERVIPVVPTPYHTHFEKHDRSRLMSLSSFIEMLTEAHGRQESLFA
ncbi:MAG: restriction endonuclease [Spirochaetia bacterium]|nr:restriction endonuclease [Spirochaetia bacterium]